LYSVTATTTFRAGHQLKLAGRIEAYHIHDWVIKAAVGGKSLDENNLLFDFNKLKKILGDAVSQFNGQKLEDLDCFKGINTSAENIARYLYDDIKNSLPERIKLLYVEVTETPGCSARYSEKMSV
jgi:6-pyruvoyltetrahydropterin/6-carboxytetrahydropterin synthase